VNVNRYTGKKQATNVRGFAVSSLSGGYGSSRRRPSQYSQDAKLGLRQKSKKELEILKSNIERKISNSNLSTSKRVAARERIWAIEREVKYRVSNLQRPPKVVLTPVGGAVKEKSGPRKKAA